MSTSTHSFRVVVADDEAEVGRRAGAAAACAIKDAIERRGKARVIFASAPSQSSMLATLVGSDVDWSKVEAFHMDEYIGIDPADPRAFGQWLADRLPVDDMARFERIDLAPEELAKPVELTKESREQQVIDGCFDTSDETPSQAVSLTVSALMGAHDVVSTVIGDHKAQAVADALEGPLSAECPASILRFHPDAVLVLDRAAAAKLSAAPMLVA